MHSATIKYFRTLELMHFQIKIPKRGQAKAKEGRMLPLPPLKETLPTFITEALHLVTLVQLLLMTVTVN